MSTVIGSSIAGTPAYPARPEVKVVMDTPNPHGYTEQSGQFGTRAGTIIPHNDPARSFADQQKPRHNVPISVVAFREASAQNPFGGFEMLVPPMPSEAITEEIRTQAMQRASQMHSDPLNQGVAAYQIMSDLINSGGVKAAVPVAAGGPITPPPPEPVAVPPTVSQMDFAALANMARLLGLMQAGAAVPTATAALPPGPTPVYPPPGPLPPPPPPPAAPPVSVLDSLMIPGLSAVPSKPLAQVQFDLGPLGNQMSFWHWVVETKTALCLVFDTRYDYPMWTPPNLGAEQPINVTLHNTQKGPLAVPCFSCGLNFRFGVFECTILVVAADG